jgi:hypothetical protein
MVPLDPEKLNSNNHFTIFNRLKLLFRSAIRKLRPELREVEKLAAQLQELPAVENVRVIRDKKNTSHVIVFQILSHVDSNSRSHLLKSAISLAVKTERNLDRIFNVEDWDLRIRIVERYENTHKSQRVILINA